MKDANSAGNERRKFRRLTQIEFCPPNDHSLLELEMKAANSQINALIESRKFRRLRQIYSCKLHIAFPLALFHNGGSSRCV